MDWVLGIGVLLIGIALIIVAVILIKPLGKLTEVLESVKKTTDTLPSTVADLTGQTQQILHTSNETISNVNKQITEVTPVFEIVGDVGEASREVTTAALDRSVRLKERVGNASDFVKEKEYKGLYGLVTIVFYLLQQRKELKKLQKL
ncbi:DUF948 domain-containing protein [Mammaliicoccus sciuri]|uniref:Uncharacterized protein YoxC, contains an MCP-like domain n=2 Tax=Sporosarcina newyorkensis TaxID=759851 RepID=A0A1T4XKY0_9BACL|nr:MULTISPECIES: DUF948 domain-containing protein [Sporosarcina]EGQ27973.1 hypothetical protein HMPREF9372_0015 [Sporosarcina newyorkensis 2681]MBY0222609.1 DUF948 domain-containing protein [Sporosarcina aquimarina]SKA90212.1 Uncharacterized protein YoxC, contains an MCP-like domain [Sporosarcina newyorkensis]